MRRGESRQGEAAEARGSRSTAPLMHRLRHHAATPPPRHRHAATATQRHATFHGKARVRFDSAF